MSKLALRNGLDNCYADRAYFICAKTVKMYGEAEIETISSWLEEWASQGSIRILKRLSESLDSERCVQLLQFIGKNTKAAEQGAAANP
jgi:hypothetical protein